MYKDQTFIKWHDGQEYKIEREGPPLNRADAKYLFYLPFNGQHIAQAMTIGDLEALQNVVNAAVDAYKLETHQHNCIAYGVKP